MSACYIAGPMRGLPEYNYPAFFAAEDALRAAGWDPIYNPAGMDREYDKVVYEAWTIEEQKLHDTAQAARHFAWRDVNILIKRLSAENCDAIILLPGYEASTGATAELAVARWVMLRVLTIDQALNFAPSHSSTCKPTEYQCPVEVHTEAECPTRGDN